MSGKIKSFRYLLLCVCPTLLSAAEPPAELNSSDTLTHNKPLLLDISPDIIKEPENQAQTNKKQLLPDIFKEQQNHDVSFSGDLLINDRYRRNEIIDGAEISVKLKTD